MSTRHDWAWVNARTPSGKTRRVSRCRKCGLVTYAVGRLTRWHYPHGHIAETATIDEPTCPGGPAPRKEEA